MQLLIKTDDGLNNVPDEAREVVKERSSQWRNLRQVKEAVNIVDDKIGDLKQAQNSGQNTVLIVNIHHRGDTDKGLKWLVEFTVESISNEPLSSALGMADPDNLGEVALGVR